MMGFCKASSKSCKGLIVRSELKRVQERNARELTREGAAENGDIVDIDFEKNVSEWLAAHK